MNLFNLVRDLRILLAMLIVLHLLASCNANGGFGFGRPLKAQNRITGHKDSIINTDTINIERTASGDNISLTFETKDAANCQFGFVLNDSAIKTPATFVPCIGKSALKFSEIVTGVPKDKLVSVVVHAWKTNAAVSSARPVLISEGAPAADSESINLLLVDIGGQRLELTSLSSSTKPSEIISKHVANDMGCALSDSKIVGFSEARKAILLQSASSRGFVNAVASRVTPSIIAGTFKSIQRASTEWSVSAKTADGFGQIRVAKPALLNTVTFSGVTQSLGISDELEDLDPPVIKVQNSLEVSWSIAGDTTKSNVVFAVAPSQGFAGITCKEAASKGKVVIPAELLSKIPAGQRLWTSLRLDTWQGLENERWVVRVSDWNTMGIQKM